MISDPKRSGEGIAEDAEVWGDKGEGYKQDCYEEKHAYTEAR